MIRSYSTQSGAIRRRWKPPVALISASQELVRRTRQLSHVPSSWSCEQWSLCKPRARRIVGSGPREWVEAGTKKRQDAGWMESGPEAEG